MPSSQAIKFELTENQDLRICSTATTINGSDTHRSLTGGDDVIGFGITTLLEVFDCKFVIVFLSFLGFSFFFLTRRHQLRVYWKYEDVPLCDCTDVDRK